MREGVSNAEIASYLATEGLITQREKTFASYLGAYKRKNFSFVTQGVSRADALANRNFDGIIGNNGPELDVERELEKVAKFQKRRLAIGHIIEESTGFVNQSLHRDVKEMRETLTELDKVRGGQRGSGRKKSQLEVTAEASESLRAVAKSETTQDKLTNLAGQLQRSIGKREQEAHDDGA